MSTTSDGEAGQAVEPQLVGLAADRGGPAGDLRLVPADADDEGVGVGQIVAVAAGLLGGGAYPAELALAVLDGSEGDVELVGVLCGQPRGAGGAVAADEHGDLLLRGLGQRGRVREVVVGAVEVEGLAEFRRPEAGDDLQLLLEAGELLLGERDAVGLVLLLEPAGAEAELDAAAGHLVDLRDLDGEHAGQPEGTGGHQGAEPDALGLTGESGQGEPGVGGAWQAVAGAHAEVVVGTEEGVEAEVLGGLGDGEQRVIGGPLLGLGEDAEIHASILHAGVGGEAVGPLSRAVPGRVKLRAYRGCRLTRPVTGPGGDRWLGRSRSPRLPHRPHERRGRHPRRPPRGPWAEEAVMSEETVPQQGGTGQPKGLLQQMEELMAALNADLSALDADLQAAGDSRPGAGRGGPGRLRAGAGVSKAGVSGARAAFVGGPVPGRSG